MTTHTIIMLAIKGSLALMVVGVGLQSTLRDATFLLRRPGLLARSFLAMSVLMPLLAVNLARGLTLTPVVSLALVALMLSPLPPFLPLKVTRAGADGSYGVGLLVVASVASVAVLPLSVALLSHLLSTPLRVAPMLILKLIGTSVLVPLFIGMALRAAAPTTASRFGTPLTMASTIVLIAALIPILVTAWPAMRSLIGNGTLVAIVSLTLIGLAVGHLLGGPERHERTVLAMATASRHPAVAIAILGANYPDEKQAAAAVLLALVVGAVAGVPYALWSKRRSAHRQAVPVPA